MTTGRTVLHPISCQISPPESLIRSTCPDLSTIGLRHLSLSCWLDWYLCHLSLTHHPMKLILLPSCRCRTRISKSRSSSLFVQYLCLFYQQNGSAFLLLLRRHLFSRCWMAVEASIQDALHCQYFSGSADALPFRHSVCFDTMRPINAV